MDSDCEFVDDAEISKILDEREESSENDTTLSSTSSADSNSQTSTKNYENPSPHHLKILKKYFGHSNFRPLQWKIISSILNDKRDNCVIMSTGYGKSLCYQYPAVYSGNIVLVISPLISLMEDQVLSLKVCNISCCLLGTAQKEKKKVMEQIFENKFSIIYLTPEFATGDYGKELLSEMNQKLDICLVAVDEAHCISSWGHDFRHQYRQLGRVRDILVGVPFLAVTATATQKVEYDIIKSLKMKNPQVLHSGYDRPNLYLEAHSKSGPTSDFNKVLNQVCGKFKFPGPTIVYCLTRKTTDTIAELLTSKGVKCASYHAGKSLKERTDVHEKFSRDQLDCIVATSAFGMGIDKPDIRCVVHYGTPSSIEEYYQEIGRAGRDGEQSRCVLFFSEGDFKTHLMICDKNSYSKRSKDKTESMASTVRKYLYLTECRRKFILSYFGENYTGENKRCCDVCYSKKTRVDQEYEGLDSEGFYDFTPEAEKVLKSIEALNGKFGMTIYILFLRGSKAGKLKDSHKNHPLYGCGKDKSENWWKCIFHMLTEEKYISKKPFSMNGFTNYLFTVSEKGESFLMKLSNRDDVKLRLKPGSDILQQLKPKVQKLVHKYNTEGSVVPSAKAVLVQNVFEQNKQEEVDKKLYASMLDKRYQIADEKDCVPHNVISIPDIKELIRVKPRTLKELEKCNFAMFSEIKIHQFGQYFIDIIVKEIGPAVTSKRSIADALLISPLPGKCGESAEISFNLLKQGLTIEEISEERKMAQSTVVNHLLDCMRTGFPIKLKQMGVNQLTRLTIVRAALESPGYLLTPTKEKCPPEITWDQVRAVVMYMKIRDHLWDSQVEFEDFEDFSYDSLKNEAGSLDLKHFAQSEVNNSAPSTTKEDENLDEFLKICEDLIRDDEQSGQVQSVTLQEDGNSKRGEKRKLCDSDSDVVYKCSNISVAMEANQNSVEQDSVLEPSDDINESDDEIFRSPPRSEYALDLPQLKISKI